jgi:hypothetical protein
LPQNPPSRGAQCAAYRDFALPRHGARQHQVHQIHASDQQHQRYRDHQDPDHPQEHFEPAASLIEEGRHIGR